MQLEGKRMSNEEEKIGISAIRKFFSTIFGGFAYQYRISVNPSMSLHLRYEGDNFFADFTERDISVRLKFEDKFDKMLFNTATVSEVKNFMPNALNIYNDGCVSYPIRENIMPTIAKEVRNFVSEFIQPLKDKIFREVTEEYIRSRKLAEKIGRK
jgi:hypothetical protein